LWWSGLTLLAILWWLIPLVVLGQYSPPFLDWIESAEFTTSITEPTAVLRGADHWLAYLGNASMWKAGWMLATYPALIVATGIIAAMGVAGLAMRSLPHRTFLVGATVAGLVVVTAGHTGVMSGLGSEQIQDFLDGAGAPLRNVHKFDLLLRIPLIIAFCHVLTQVWPTGGKPRWKVLVTGVAITALVASSWPALTGQLTRGRTYVAVADHWRDTSQWLNEQAEPGRALIVPGASFAQFVWGRTQDEPLQAFGGYPWGVRDAVPLSSAGNIRMLDAVEARLEAGQPSPGLAQYLQRMGVRYLVVRNDLAPGAAAPAPIRIHQALDGSTGIRRVAWFGPIVDQPGVGPALTDEGTRVSYPAVEVFEVQPSNDVADPRVLLRPANGTLAVDGSPEAVLNLADAGMLGNRPVILAGDPQARGINAAAGVVTDTDRRREITFGYMRGNESATMTADQPYTQQRPVHDYRVFGEAGTTVAAPGLQFDASSSAADVDATFRTPRGATPAAAMDGALDTYWRPGAFPERVSYWEVRYDQPVELGDTLRVALMNRGYRNPTTVPLIITTDTGQREVDAVDNDAWQDLPVSPGRTSFVRITKPEQLGQTVAFGLREVGLPGEGVSALQLPSGAAGDAVLLSARPGDAGQCLPRDDTWICSDDFGRFSQDRVGLHRIVDLPADLSSTPRIWATPRDATSITAKISEIAGAQVVASSTRTREVAGSALSAFDRNVGTAWQAAPNDPKPSVTVSLPQQRTIRGIRLVNRLGLNASSPLEITVTAGGRTFNGFTDSRGLLRFDPVTTDLLTMTFPSSNQVRSRSSLGETVLPVGVSEIGLIGADDLRQPLPGDALLTLPCGTGPDVMIDGEVTASTAVSARVDQLQAGATLPMTLCADQVTLPAGQHRVVVASSQAYQPMLAVFAPDSFYAATSRPVSPEVSAWEQTSRTVEFPASEEPQVLEIAENYNLGWSATADGASLAPVRVDGWKQAFIVPAGVGGPVSVEFQPNTTYRAGLLAGLLAVLMVLWIAVRPPRLRPLEPVQPVNPGRIVAGLVGVGVILTFGPWGVVAFALGWVMAQRWNPPIVAAAAVMSAVLLSAAAGVRPAWPVVMLQGTALAVALAAVAWVAWSRATAVGDPSGSSPAQVAR
jgi:arabinofuranan 3-O-arabinosyltransferase